MSQRGASRSTTLPRLLTWAFLKVLAIAAYAFVVLRVLTPYLISAHDDLALIVAITLFATLPIALIWLVWSVSASRKRINVERRLIGRSPH